METAPGPNEPSPADAMGRMLRNCWKAGGTRGKVFEVIERADGFVGVCDAADYFSPHPEWPDREQHVIEQARGRVLDVGCGAGRHAVYLADNGFEVTGVDSSPGAVAVARQRSVNAVLGSAQKLPCEDGAFDTILALGANLGLLGGQEQARVTLDEWARVAAPGAQILATGRDPYVSADRAGKAYHETNRRAGRMGGQLRIRIRYGTLADPYFDYLYCSQEELQLLVDPSPWEVQDFREGPHGAYGVVMSLK
ncbi:class I SAM-dependent methyltransferase [Streptomyces sp. NPDC003006]